MPEENGQEKTEKATDKKREDARKKGQICQSKEIPAAVMLLFGCAFFYFFAPALFSSLVGMVRSVFLESGSFELNSRTFFPLIVDVIVRVGVVILPFLAIALAIAVASNVAQFGFNFSVEALTPKLEKIDPFKGMKRLFSLAKLFDLFKNAAKITVVGLVAYTAVKSEWDNFVPIMQQSPATILKYMGRLTFLIAIKIGGAMVALAVLDYLYQRYEYEKKLMMTKQEIKDEFKQREGDPQVKARIRRLQMEMAQRRMMEDVPKADVVITNPTHIAIALSYQKTKFRAPVVLAKGKGFLAQRIREIAEEHKVPIVEKKPLAQALYKLVDVGSAIPEELYQGVAEILAYVYRLKKKVV